jgi:nitroimidazol reductase NimA-like FMN-containing flavoprotein (pyridoxamine 5'-phosphate oxidase superfamily)
MARNAVNAVLANRSAAPIKVVRFPKRGRYDRATLLSILESGFVCHVAFNHGPTPTAIPMLYWFDQDHLYLHGSRVSRLMKEILGRPVCVTVTHVDGLVLARSAFHHSANYRSACVFGVAREVEGSDMKLTQLRAMMERLFPGRWESLRPVKGKELAATRIAAVPLTRASAKVRVGAPEEDSADARWPVWGGVIPLALGAGIPVPDEVAVGSGRPAPTLAVSMGPGPAR